MTPRRTMRGITLIELLTTLAVLAIVAGIGAPTLSHWGARLRERGMASEVVSSLAFARITAVSRNEPVTLCPSPDGERCTGGTDWSRGWIAYADAERADQPAASDRILRRFGALPAGMRLDASVGRARVRFQPEGWAAGSNVTLQLCLAGETPMHVVVNNAGRARVDAGSTAKCPDA